MTSYAQDIITGLSSLLTGMKVTIKTMFTKGHTVQWPRQTAQLPLNFRGHIRLVANDSTGFAKCIACGSCVRACPSNCIEVKGEKPEGAKKKSPTLFRLDFTKCSLCGLCVESCPVAAITFSRDYALAGLTSEPFAAMNLLDEVASPFAGEEQ
ncbi:MAG: NADH-quinone oxidoreductase subunit I [Desulfobulbus sp.]|nr:MAG: NADH-quinone oxidoreductase subunit I [Desulfobulbus sp.]RUM38788.1 MAG: NADH-quinone oxidoreductase subunit I [Desulfobulbus sp.]RUM40904.1 MAG: NADH-quinone oxidoreductase subunit I [Desulfobulbus sp.]